MVFCFRQEWIQNVNNEVGWRVTVKKPSMCKLGSRIGPKLRYHRLMFIFRKIDLRYADHNMNIVWKIHVHGNKR
jgi:hypothetical protein